MKIFRPGGSTRDDSDQSACPHVSAESSPVGGPVVSGACLPDVLDVSDGAAGEDLEASVVVPTDDRVRHDVSAEAEPVAIR